MLFPHNWVRGAADRLLGHYFANLSEMPPFAPMGSNPPPKSKKSKGKEREKDKETKEVFLAKGGALFRFASLLCKQLDSRIVDAALGEQIVKNLVFLFREIVAHPELIPIELISKANEEMEEGDDREVEDDENAGSATAGTHSLLCLSST